MKLKSRRELIYSKVASIITYGIELYSGASQSILQKVSTILMKCNKAIFMKDYFRVSNLKICKEISVDPPILMCDKAAARFMHRVISDKAPKQIYEKLKFNKNHRKCSNIGLKTGFSKETNKRTLINTSLNIYNGLKPALKYLQKSKFKCELKKLKTLRWK